MAALDNVMRPLLIRRGVQLPPLLIVAGVIGGLISFGVVGLFVGPSCSPRPIPSQRIGSHGATLDQRRSRRPRGVSAYPLDR